MLHVSKVLNFFKDLEYWLGSEYNKELSLRVDANETKVHFFEFLEPDKTISIKQGENLEDLSQIVALDASLDQYDRIQEILMQDY